MSEVFVISLGGSLVAPEAGRVDVEFLKKFRALILKYVVKGNRFAIIVGGGKLCRAWQGALRQARGILPERIRQLAEESKAFKNDLDWIGIRTTQANAELVRAIFGKFAYPRVVADPEEKVGNFKIVIGAGFKPGHSTDYDAIVRAQTIGAKTVLNLSDVPYIYNKDPKKFKDAKPFKRLLWQEYIKLFGGAWQPGVNLLFDSKASQLARRARIAVTFISGKDLKNLDNYFNGKAFEGTVVR